MTKSCKKRRRRTTRRTRRGRRLPCTAHLFLLCVFAAKESRRSHRSSHWWPHPVDRTSAELWWPLGSYASRDAAHHSRSWPSSASECTLSCQLHLVPEPSCRGAHVEFQTTDTHTRKHREGVTTLDTIRIRSRSSAKARMSPTLYFVLEFKELRHE